MAGRIKPWGETARSDGVRGLLLGGFIATGSYLHNMHSSGWGSDVSPAGSVSLVLLPTAAAVIGGYLIRRYPEHHRRLSASLFPTDDRLTSDLRAKSDQFVAWWRGLGQRWRPRR
jgi:hypothetical protein